MRARLQNFINGEFTDAESDSLSEVIDPSTGVVYAQAPVSGERDVDAAYRAAAAAFEKWRDVTPQERSNALLKFADAVEARAEEIVEAECKNTGKPRGLTMSDEVPPMVDNIRFFAAASRILEGKATGEYLADHTSSIRREPIGVVGQVTPWNYPMMMAVWKFAPAIAAGNTVVLKPSETTPVSTLLLAEIAAEFFPPGVFNVICGDRDTGRALTAHPVPQMLALTGSVRAGMEVARAAAADLKRVHLELGGKAPVVVFDDADVASAAARIAGAGYFNAGQDCTAACRVLVDARIADDFTAALAEAARGTKVGGLDVADADFGPVNNADRLAVMKGFMERTRGEVLAGGHQVGDRGYLFAPTVVSGLEQDDELVQDEVFGPVITVQSFTDEDLAVRWANDVRYGLSASVWTNDHRRAMRMTKRLDFGAVWVNTHIPFVSEMPHGGFKHSGYGKDLSIYGFEDYTRIKHVMHYIGE
ncbi:aminobutyraldehyde dehydrogenase [Rhizohabitans arisaemae]|uniref:aminobutyraldehyde dehydrogenase n=1 Tax=Rhizohabitans arisaemae TaxID=2720610 RepID=UPI0024B12F2E|nr:aminobutyraldehyde dehydrogenase [Rhizohabitans arisaemae]